MVWYHQILIPDNYAPIQWCFIENNAKIVLGNAWLKVPSTVYLAAIQSTWPHFDRNGVKHVKCSSLPSIHLKAGL